MAEDDDDLGFDDEDAAEQAEKEKAEAEAKAKAEADAAAAEKDKADAAAKAESEKQQQEALGAATVALKSSWVEQAKAAGATAADYDSIGLAGFDEAAKEKFLAAAAESHTKRVEELAAQGFVFDPGAAGREEADKQDDAQAQQWGAFGPGQTSSGDEKLAQLVAEEVQRGDTRGVIGSLLEKGGMGEFFARGRRS